VNELLSGTQIAPAVSVTAWAAASTAIEGSAIDSANYEGVMFVAQLGAIVSGAVTSLKLQESADGSTGWTDVASTSITVADDDDSGIRYLDYRRPAERYVRLYVSRATQNATLTATALLYGAKSQPLTQPTATEGVAVSG
jgi:hypothetical protein